MNKIVFVIVLSMLTANVLAESVCDDAVSEFNSGPLENDQRSIGQAQSLMQVEQFFGAFQSASILSTRELGSRSCYIIGILEYENGPAFAVANYYRGTKGVGATSMFFKTEPEQILPKEFLVK